jgi:hypothetical protein
MHPPKCKIAQIRHQLNKLKTLRSFALTQRSSAFQNATILRKVP